MTVQINKEDYAKPWRPGVYPKSTTVIYNNQLWILNDSITGLFSSSDFLTEVANGDWIGRYTTEGDLATVAFSGDYNDLINQPVIPITQIKEIVFLQNRWTLTNANVYYRSRGDYSGFNDMIMITQMVETSDYASLSQANRSNSSFFYVANGNKKLDKIYLDISSGGTTTTSYTIMVVACQRVNSSSTNTSTINEINLGEYNVTKASGEVTSFYTITPIDVTIPDGYVVTYFLKRLDGTAEVNITTHFHFKNI